MENILSRGIKTKKSAQNHPNNHYQHLALNMKSACARCRLQRGLQRNYRKERDWKDCIVCTAYFCLVKFGFRSNSPPHNKVCFPTNFTE